MYDLNSCAFAGIVFLSFFACFCPSSVITLQLPSALGGDLSWEQVGKVLCRQIHFALYNAM